jgi:hypothetical protein
MAAEGVRVVGKKKKAKKAITTKPISGAKKIKLGQGKSIRNEQFKVIE